MKILWFLVFVSAIGSSLQRSTRSDDSYVAAVLEYAFTENHIANLEHYWQHIRDAAAQGADIVVFPEMTLRSDPVEVPINGSLTKNPIPAWFPQLYAPVLVALSVAAREHQIYVVINLEEICDCTKNDQGENCPEAKIYYFNTNVVFDRNGAITDRYRKINKFGDFIRSPALTPDLGIFTTDFGVTFGHFISFDLMFQVPSVQVVEHGIKDVILTNMWFSDLPYLTAVQIQEGYAYTLNVNVLASGANKVQRGSAGSGIYSGKVGALISTMPGVPKTRLLVHRVPKEPGNITDISGPIVDPPEELDGLNLKVDPSLRAHLTRLLVPGSQEFTLTDGEVSCRFKVRLNHGIAEPHYEYRAMALDSVRRYDIRGNRVCSVVACKDAETVESCGLRFDTYNANSNAIFEELTIEANVPGPLPVYDSPIDEYDLYPQDAFDPLHNPGCWYDSTFYPLSVNSSILPLRPSEYTYVQSRDGNKTVLVMDLINPTTDLYSFAVWGRVVEKYGEEPTEPINIGNVLYINYTYIMLMTIFLVNLF